MQQTFFVPARNSRHRIAAIALYRALIRAGRKIPLPDGAAPHGHVHPVTSIVRKRFEGHRNYTSLRLVYSTMTVGYKFLTLFTKAQTSGSKEHAEIVQHLQKRHATPKASRTSRPERTPPPQREPMLIKMNPYFAPPEYAPNPLFRPPVPDRSPENPGRVPSLVADAFGIPFIRFRKPQPLTMSKWILSKRKKHVQYVTGSKAVEELTGIDAVLEDEWEDMVEEQIAAESGRPKATAHLASTYIYGECLSKLWYELRSEIMHQDCIARGDAMHEVVEMERDLVAWKKKFAKRPKTYIRGLKEREAPNKLWTRASYDYLPTVEEWQGPTMHSLHHAEAAVKEIRKSKRLADDEEVDPFAPPVWPMVVKRIDYRLVRWCTQIRERTKKFKQAKKQQFNVVYGG